MASGKDCYVLDIKRTFLSDIEVSERHSLSDRKIQSERLLHSETNYDDLCGDWQFPENPAHTKHVTQQIPVLCTWKFITQEDVSYMKEHQYDKNLIFGLIGAKMSAEGQCDVGNKFVFLELMWETIIFARDHSFTDKSLSTIVGLMCAVHSFFLSNAWRTAEEVYTFFSDSVFRHSVLDPPKSEEIFTPSECVLVFELFQKLYMENLVLLRLLCVPNYCLVSDIGSLKVAVEEVK